MFKYNDYVQVTEGFFKGCKGWCVNEHVSWTPPKTTYIQVELDTDSTGESMDDPIRSFPERELKHVQ